jgi:type I restriction enzyme S subunit
MSTKAKTRAKKEDATPALVPRLRFPEFRGSEGWKTTALGDVCKLYQSETIASSEFVADGKHLVYGANGVVGRLDRFNHEAEEVVVSCRGNCGEVHLTKPRSWITGNAMVVSPKSKDLTKQFLFWLLGAANLKPVISGSAQPQITRQGFSPFEVAIPFPAEQQKIAECLSSVDELMAAQARKLDALKTHKKGLMQQLFPRKGETQPRLRFPEFQNAGEWEDDTLQDLCTAKISYGIVQAGPHVADGMPYIKSSDLNSELCLANLARTSDAIAQKYRRSEVLPGDIVFSLRGNIGVAQIVPIGIPVANLTQGTARIRTKGSPEFYFYALRSPFVHGRILAAGKGSTFQEISLEALRNIRLFHPQPAEQQGIASCLSSLDALITAETQKLETLKTHKRGLMQQLFPSQEEPNS